MELYAERENNASQNIQPRHRKRLHHAAEQISNCQRHEQSIRKNKDRTGHSIETRGIKSRVPNEHRERYGDRIGTKTRPIPHDAPVCKRSKALDEIKRTRGGASRSVRAIRRPRPRPQRRPTSRGPHRRRMPGQSRPRRTEIRRSRAVAVDPVPTLARTIAMVEAAGRVHSWLDRRPKRPRSLDCAHRASGRREKHGLHL